MNAELQGRLDSLIGHCRAAGLKATHQRIEIYRELLLSGVHPDAETIFRKIRKRIPSISFDTVYRTLRRLAELGLISRVHTPEGRLRFDANLSRHHHFVCEKCGAVLDFCSSEFDGLSVPADVGKIGVPGSLKVEVMGVCHQCGRKTGAGEKRKKQTRQ